MNKYILIATFMLLGTNVFAENRYKDVTTIDANGITYEVRYNEGLSFALRNTSNTLASEANWRYKDGSVLETLSEYDKASATTDNNSGVYRALREAFGDMLITKLRAYKRSPMSIFFVIGPEGNTLEVSFIMKDYSELTSLSPAVFANLERKLKEYVIWELNDFAKGLEFMHMQGYVHFSHVPLSTEKPEWSVSPDPGLKDDSESLLDKIQE